MSVFIYADTISQAGDPEHLKVFANQEAALAWFAENDPEGVAFEYEVNSVMTAREAYDRFQQEVAHILDCLKRNS